MLAVVGIETKMNNSLFAYHFEPQSYKQFHFVNNQGNFIINPKYEYKLTNIEIDTVLCILEDFPLNLSLGWMCLPIYRDVLIWKDSKNKMTKMLQICFDCHSFLLSNSIKSLDYIERIENYDSNNKIQNLENTFKEFDKKVGYKRIEKP